MKIEHVAALRETLERMETQQLDALLLEELRKESPNAELIRMISGILKERDQDIVPQINADIQQAWEQYQRKTTPVRKKPKELNSILIKAASLVLVVLTLMALLPQEADAANFFQRFIAWTEDVFSLLSSSEEDISSEEYIFQTDNPGLQEVYDKVTELGVTSPVVPMWLPGGYELVELTVEKTPIKAYVMSRFSYETTEIVYQLDIYSDTVTTTYFKGEETIQEEEMHGTTHTILRNMDLLIAVWTKDNIECSICIDCPEETLIRILKSIYTMEDN